MMCLGHFMQPFVSSCQGRPVWNWSLIGSVACEKMSYVQYLLGNFWFKYTPSCNSPEEVTVSKTIIIIEPVHVISNNVTL